MIKLCSSDSWAWGERCAKLMPVSSRGILDVSWLNKFAVDDDHRAWLRKIASVAGHELLHIIAVGDSERYGYNRNGDGFSGRDNAKSHDGFCKNAYVFRNHKHDTRKGHPTFGRPHASCHSPKMARIELVNAVNCKTAGDIIQGVEKGDDVAWSMGCNVPFDVCTVCHNKAASPAEYCEHAKRPNLGRLLKTGEICALDNPDAEWFDISHVFRPAERIAYTIRKIKVAAANGQIALDDDEAVCGGAELAKIAGVTLPEFMLSSDIPLEKWATLQALAELEKHVPADGSARAWLPEELSEEAEKAIAKQAAADGSMRNVLEDLHGRGILLRPRQLFKIAFGPEAYNEVIEPLMPEMRQALPDAFSRALEINGGDLVKESRFDGAGQLKTAAMTREYEDATVGCEKAASIQESHASARAGRISLLGCARPRIIITKTASVQPAAGGLSDIYAAYGLAFASHPRNGREVLAKRAVVMTNQEESVQ